MAHTVTLQEVGGMTAFQQFVFLSGLLFASVPLAARAAMPAPRLIAPGDGWTVSRIAADFRSANCTDDRDFWEFCKRQEQRPIGQRYLPEELVPAGVYFWRVRAIGLGGEPGEWSEARRLTVIEKTGTAPLVREISTTRPLLLVLRASAYVVSGWQLLWDEGLDPPQPIWMHYTLPLLKALVEKGLIVTREEALPESNLLRAAR